jgi:hypothetical protein
MQKYRIFDTEAIEPERDVYRGTQRAAQLVMQKWPVDQRYAIEIQLVDLPTTKGYIEAWLNGEQPKPDEDFAILRRWRGKRTGGLQELPKPEYVATAPGASLIAAVSP